MKQCRKCTRWFAGQQALQQHLRSPAHRVSCDLCRNFFPSQGALQRHLQSPVHRHKCRACDKTFKTAERLEQHLDSSVHSHECSYCDRTFRSSTALDQHLQSPTHRFECPHCNRTFRTDGSLEQHKQAVHEARCHRCARRSWSRSSLAQHVVDRHLDLVAIARAVQSTSRPLRPVRLATRIVDAALREQVAETECSICMDQPALGDQVSRLPCNHWFHTSCLQAWIAEHSTCPNCRVTIADGDG